MDFLQQLHIIRAELEHVSVTYQSAEMLTDLLAKTDYLVDVAIPYSESVLASSTPVKDAIFQLDERWWMTIDIVIGRADYLRTWSKYTELFTRLFDIVSSLRQWTIDQVFDDDITSEELVAILHAPNYHLRYEAVTRLRNYPAVLTTVIPDLIQIMVANGSMRLNHAIRQTLATVSDAAARQLRPLLSPDNDERLHWHAVSTLRWMGCDALEVIIDAWPTASDDLRRRIAVILCSFPQYPDYVVPLLLDALKSIDSDLRFDAVKALKCFQLFASDAVPILEALLKDEPDIARRRKIEGVLKLIAEAG